MPTLQNVGRVKIFKMVLFSLSKFFETAEINIFISLNDKCLDC